MALTSVKCIIFGCNAVILILCSHLEKKTVKHDLHINYLIYYILRFLCTHFHMLIAQCGLCFVEKTFGLKNTVNKDYYTVWVFPQPVHLLTINRAISFNPIIKAAFLKSGTKLYKCSILSYFF